MRRLMLISALALCASPVFAADMLPLKAAALSTRVDSGFYFGAEAGAAVANTTVKGGLFANALANGNLTAAGGTVGGCVGYMRGGPGRWWGAQGCVDYQNITASALNVSNASRWSATQEVRVGGSMIMDWVQSVLPNLGVTGFTFPTFMPPSLNGFSYATAPRSYFALGAHEFGFNGTAGNVRTGDKFAVAPMLKFGAIWQTLDSAGNANGGAVDTFAQVVFAKKALVLAQNGGTVDYGRIYKAGVAYNFAVPR